VVTQNTSRQADAESPGYNLDPTPISVDSSWDEILSEIHRLTARITEFENGGNGNGEVRQR